MTWTTRDVVVRSRRAELRPGVRRPQCWWPPGKLANGVFAPEYRWLPSSFSNSFGCGFGASITALGYAAVSFGAPVSLHAFMRGNGAQARLSRHLAEELMRRIGEEVPVLPVPLVATALLQADHPLTRDGVGRRRQRAYGQIAERPCSHIPRDDRSYAVEVGCEICAVGRRQSSMNGCFSVSMEDRPLMKYYAASICASVSPARRRELIFLRSHGYKVSKCTIVALHCCVVVDISGGTQRDSASRQFG